jgi:uncharacterized metal-binding protein
MPSGKTHDAITIILSAPVFAAAFAATADPKISIAVTAAFLFGGLAFGPDLDTMSKQYSRWLFLRPLWFPYRAAFKHRSRWSHGLIFGTLFRVVYFMGAASLVVYLAFLLNVSVAGDDPPKLSVFADAWRQLGSYIRGGVGEYFLAAVFVGVWAGAASHTFTDMAGTYVKTGRITEFL